MPGLGQIPAGQLSCFHVFEFFRSHQIIVERPQVDIVIRVAVFLPDLDKSGIPEFFHMLGYRSLRVVEIIDEILVADALSFLFDVMMYLNIFILAGCASASEIFAISSMSRSCISSSSFLNLMF